MNDSIKIVSPNEIYLLSDLSLPHLPPVPSNHNPNPPIDIDNNPSINPYYSTSTTLPSGTEHNINITPIIKVFNHGNDMSIPDIQTPNIDVPSTSYTTNTRTDSTIEKRNTVENGEKDTAIDFNNLIIKKM
jgi:hypothetical protein